MVVDGAEIRQANIGRTGDRYDATVQAVVNAPVEQVRAVLTDYDRFDRIHSAVVGSRSLGTTPDGDARVRVDAEFCVLFFCFEIGQVSRFSSEANGVLVAVIEPEVSDFHSGRFQWRLTREEAYRTRIDFEGEVEPSIWIPPIIGPWILERKLPQLARTIAANLERLALEREQ